MFVMCYFLLYTLCADKYHMYVSNVLTKLYELNLESSQDHILTLVRTSPLNEVVPSLSMVMNSFSPSLSSST